MTDSKSRRVSLRARLVAGLVVSVSAVASLPQVESAWNGVKEVYGEQDFGLRILREVMLVVP